MRIRICDALWLGVELLRALLSMIMLFSGVISTSSLGIRGATGIGVDLSSGLGSSGRYDAQMLFMAVVDTVERLELLTADVAATEFVTLLVKEVLEEEDGKIRNFSGLGSGTMEGTETLLIAGSKPDAA